MEPAERPEVLENAPLRYAPQTELGVVFLFASMLRRWRLRVEKIRPGFPDCIAYQRVGGREKRVRIEFELRSSSFRSHKHAAKGCDWIVCWEHDWAAVPPRLRVIELRKYFGLGFKVWIQPARRTEWHELDEYARLPWALSKRATKGDLLLMYRCVPEKCIRDVYRLTSGLTIGKAGWRQGNCYHGEIRLLCRLDSPIFLLEMQRHPVLGTAGFIRRNLQGNVHVTEYWPDLYEMIVSRNPRIMQKLLPYAPDSRQ